MKLLFHLNLLWLIFIAWAAQAQDKSFIKQVEADPSLYPNGLMTEATLPKFFELAFKDNLAQYPQFASANCMSAQNIKQEGGYNTIQLFALTSTCTGSRQIYIIKEPANGLHESSQLFTLSNYPGLKELIDNKPDSGLPTVTLPVAYLSYAGPAKQHYLLVMYRALGSSFCNVITDFKTKDIKPDIPRIYRRLGLEIANFQKRFTKDKDVLIGKTLRHGDLKCLNIFYDQETNHFSLIDNESMRMSIDNPVLPQEDNFRLLFGNLIASEDYYMKNILLQGIDLAKWYDLTIKNFVDGYLETFPEEKRGQAFIELANMLNPASTPDFATTEFMNIKHLINPIFDQLRQKYSR